MQHTGLLEINNFHKPYPIPIKAKKINNGLKGFSNIMYSENDNVMPNTINNSGAMQHEREHIPKKRAEKIDKISLKALFFKVQPT